jgi:hypothetical protein
VDFSSNDGKLNVTYLSRNFLSNTFWILFISILHYIHILMIWPRLYYVMNLYGNGDSYGVINILEFNRECIHGMNNVPALCNTYITLIPNRFYLYIHIARYRRNLRYIDIRRKRKSNDSNVNRLCVCVDKFVIVK